MVNHHFQLKRSLLALLFQLGLLLVMSLIWIGLFPLYLASILMVIGIVAYILFLKRPHVIALEHLDQQFWSIQYANRSLESQFKLDKIFDHHFYIVFRFEKKSLSLVIWRDQVNLEAWKKLKLLAKLG